MKILFDLLPVVLFFAGYKLYGIFVATAIAIASTLALIVFSYIRFKRVDKMLLINGAIITALGGTTLLLHDKTFIMWKPTVLYWFGAAFLLGAQLLYGKNFIRQMLQSMLNPPEPVWRKLLWAWVAFLIALGFVNLYVAHHFSESAWVNFKLFGVTSAMFVFMAAQIMLLRSYLIEPDNENPAHENPEHQNKEKP